MARRGKDRLTVPQVRNAKKPGRLADGAGLYLAISERIGVNGERRLRKSWVFLYSIRGARKEMGLGPLERVELKAARDAADECRTLLGAGVDPIEARDARIAEEALERARAITFKDAAARYIEAQRSGWKNPKHGKLWEASLKDYAYPELGDLAVSKITVEDVIRTLQPIWGEKAETASRVRGRIEAVLSWCAVLGYRDRNTINPAAWRHNLDKVLPPRAKVAPVKHHAAMAYKDVPAFMARLRQQDGLGALALQLTVLTAVRTSEALGARWAEFDLEEAVWEIPGARTKSGRPLRVPLTRQVTDLLGRIKTLGSKTWLFPGLGTDSHLSTMAMLKTLERMNLKGVATAHGFRAAFRTWAAEQTAFAREVCEAALGHRLGDKVELAYARGDLFSRRRKLMEAWSNYLDRSALRTGEVIALKRAAEG